MAIAAEIERLKRITDEFVAGVESDLRSRAGITPGDKRALRAEIEACTQKLDELRSRLSG